MLRGKVGYMDANKKVIRTLQKTLKTGTKTSEKVDTDNQSWNIKSYKTLQKFQEKCVPKNYLFQIYMEG